MLTNNIFNLILYLQTASGAEGYNAHVKQNLKSTVWFCVGGIRLCKSLIEKTAAAASIECISTIA